MQVRFFEPPSPAYWDLSELNAKWYWRGLAWLLRKLGGAYQEFIPESVKVEERDICHADIQAMIRSSQSAIHELWSKRATTLVIGYDEMDKLMRNAPREYMTFNTRVPVGYGHRFRYAGLRVVCVPWLEGWALLPDLEGE
jgi:hypothetical protein